MSKPTFVVGTGRCGSTMLSNMLREHPKVLSLSEFFSMIADGDLSSEPFSLEPMDGARFWAIIAAVPRFYAFFMQQGLPASELLYPPGDPSARYSAHTGVPAILLTTLPHLTDQHDALFDALGVEARTWPISSISEHYHRLFGWLATRFGKIQWIERSGTMLWVEQFLTIFPDARFIHLVRDGRDVALSMQQNNLFRLGLAWTQISETLGVYPLKSVDRTHLDRVPAELTPLLPERFEVEAFRQFTVPLSTCTGYWAYLIDLGLKHLRSLNPALEEFLRFVLSRQGQQAILEQKIFIPLRVAQAASSRALLGS